MGSLKLDLDALKKWGTRKYSIADKPVKDSSKPSATWTLTTKFEKDHVVLDDSLRISAEGQVHSIHWKSTCDKNNLLSLKTLDCEEKTNGKLRRRIQAAVTDGNAKVTYEQGRDKHEETVEWPTGSVTELAMLRLVTLLPQEAGKSYRLENFSRSRKLRVRGEQVIECLGPDAKTEKRWIKFEMKNASGQSPAWSYWVSKDGVLQRVTVGSETLTLIKE
jgi:hypothetical protein